MNVPDLASIREGTLAGVMEVPWPWPVSADSVMLGQELSDGSVVVRCHRDGTISAVLSDADGAAIFETTSCKLWAQEPCASTFYVVWSAHNLEVHLNNNLVASVENVDGVPDEYRFPPNNPTGPDFDFSSENADAIAKRKQRLAGLGGTPIKRGRYRSNKDQIFEALREEVMQLNDLLELIRRGAFHHTTGLSAIVRKMISIGEPMPLLQLSAATIDAPLIIFTNAQPRFLYKDVPASPTSLIRINASSEAKMLLRNPIDIDVWLDIKTSYIAGEHVTNRFLLTKIGHTLGSHFDVDVHPAIPALRGMRSETPAGNIDFFVQLICSVADISATLGLKVLTEGTD